MSRDRFSRTTRIDLIDGNFSFGPASAPKTPLPVSAPFPLSGDRLFDRLYDAAMMTDGEGRVLRANSRAVEQLHFTPDAFEHRPITAFLPGVDHALLDQLRPSLVRGNFALIQGYARRHDQSLFPVETSVMSLDNAADRLCFCLRDITLRKQAENQWRTGFNALQNATVGIIVLDSADRILYANPAAAALWGNDDPGRLMGSAIARLFVDEEAVRAILKGLDEESGWAGDLEALRGDRSRFTAALSVAANRDSDNDRAGAVMSVRDATAERSAEESQRDAERHRAMLASLSAACHHLAQPATVMIGNIALLCQPDSLSKEEHRQVSETCLTASEELVRILHQLNNVDSYRTTPYLESSDAHPNVGGEMLDIRTGE